MGIAAAEEENRMELEELCRILVAYAGLNRRKDDDEFRGTRTGNRGIEEDDGGKLVCVTSGVSYLGLAIVNQLLLRGFSVRVLVDDPGDREKFREMELSGQMRTRNNSASAVTAKLTELDSLLEAFDGCNAVLHTSAFIDPAGLTGYSKSMAEVEVKATENLIEACSRTPSVRRIVINSSLLSCTWRDNSQGELSPVVNHECWSDEALCIDKKLWFALGKLRAEKAAWRLAEERGLRLATICHGLITGPSYCQRNPTATFAYLKGAQEMYEGRLLATVDVFKLAQANVCVLEAMKENAHGRYICFDRIIEAEDDAEQLAREIGISTSKICQIPSRSSSRKFQLSNRKLSNLMSGRVRCSYS